MELSVAEAAERLALSRRQVAELVRTGVIAGRKLSGVWLVNSDAVHQYALRRPPAGRRLSVPTAWGVLFMISGVEPEWVPARTRARLHQRLRDTSARVTARAVASRRTLRVHADGDMSAQEELIPSGRRAADVLGSDLIADDRRIDGYIPAGVTLEEFADMHLLIVDPSGPDTIREGWPEYTQVLPAVVAADLAVSIDPRERDAGLTALNEMLAEHN